MVEEHLADNGVDAAVVRLDGAVETAIQLGVADVIADVVETGTTCATPAWRSSATPILESEAVLVTPQRRRRPTARGASCAGCRASWWPAAT